MWGRMPSMDADPQQYYHESSPSVGLEVHCLVCRRALSQVNEVNEGFEAISICRECKIVLDDSDTNVTRRDLHRRRQQRRHSRYRSIESIDDLFSHQFSQLISLVRQNQETLIDGDSTVVIQQHSSYNTPQSRSGRWRRVLSDNESDGFDRTESLFGETDSMISFSGYGGNSDVSVDGLSILDRDTEMFIQLDNESHTYTDTDIDPMHAGLDQWNSDDQDEEDGEWEEADIGQYRDVNRSPIVEVQDGGFQDALVHRGTNGSQQGNYANIYAEIDLEIPTYVGDSGDYLDARGFEEFLEQLAEADGSRRGAPPAAVSCVGSLPVVIISKNHEKNGSLICAICKDLLPTGSEAKQLPCTHVYHASCILPWLSTRNSCPVCRYELPTDDPDYEEGKRNMNRVEIHNIQHQDQADESSSDDSSDTESNEVHGFGHGGGQLANAQGTDHTEDSSNRDDGRGWLILAAAPIVSIVGIVLVLWFRNPQNNARNHVALRNHDREHVQSSQSSPTPTDRNRSWWSLF